MAQATRNQTARVATRRTLPFDPSGGASRFDLPPTVIPPKGMRYEWKRLEVYGKTDTANLSRLKQEGWTPVPADRHAELMVPNWVQIEGTNKPTVIIREGLILCERREDWCQAVEQYHRDETAGRTRANRAEAGQSRDPKNYPRLQPQIERTVETPGGIEVPQNRQGAPGPVEEGSFFENDE